MMNVLTLQRNKKKVALIIMTCITYFGKLFQWYNEVITSYSAFVDLY